jgi:hypothetical protein
VLTHLLHWDFRKHSAGTKPKGVCVWGGGPLGGGVGQAHWEFRSVLGVQEVGWGRGEGTYDASGWAWVACTLSNSLMFTWVHSARVMLSGS